VLRRPNRHLAAQTATPRAAGNQTVTVSGTELAVTKCPVMGTPKSQSLAGNEARTSCCGRTLAALPEHEHLRQRENNRQPGCPGLKNQ